VSQSSSNSVKSGASLASGAADGMAVSTLFTLEYQGSLPLQRTPSVQHPNRHWVATPSIHYRAPRGVTRKSSERGQGDRDQGQRNDRYGPSQPTLFPFA